VLFRYNEEGLHQLCAIVAVACKLSGILHRMWISESDFKVRFGAKVRGARWSAMHILFGDKVPANPI